MKQVTYYDFEGLFTTKECTWWQYASRLYLWTGLTLLSLCGMAAFPLIGLWVAEATINWPEWVSAIVVLPICLCAIPSFFLMVGCGFVGEEITARYDRRYSNYRDRKERERKQRQGQATA